MSSWVYIGVLGSTTPSKSNSASVRPYILYISLKCITIQKLNEKLPKTNPQNYFWLHLCVRFITDRVIVLPVAFYGHLNDYCPIDPTSIWHESVT